MRRNKKKTKRSNYETYSNFALKMIKKQHVWTQNVHCTRTAWLLMVCSYWPWSIHTRSIKSNFGLNHVYCILLYQFLSSPFVPSLLPCSMPLHLNYITNQLKLKWTNTNHEQQQISTTHQLKCIQVRAISNQFASILHLNTIELCSALSTLFLSNWKFRYLIPDVFVAVFFYS